ncbi:hypothetical protein TWF506_004131 [Arthrobotrys conoides]|uniref:Uncharacterized protein n=1 Tax=Arthrobotrys conoides TaxID=74498 RepID=A0AAN8MXF9_9PEZI
MVFALKNVVAVAALLNVLSVQAVPFVLEERASNSGCNADNLLRLLRAPSNLPEAIPFCSAYLALPALTTTVSTVTPTATSYTTLQTNETSRFTENPTVPLTLKTTETSVIVSTVTITVPPQGGARLARRAKTTTSLADKVTGTTYPPSRISSACNCLTIPISTTSVTATADEVTETVTVLSTSSTSLTVTITSTETILETAIDTVYSTATSTEVGEPTAFPLKIVAPGTADDGAYVFNRNENPNNNGPGASQSFPLTTDPTKATKFTHSADGALRIAVSSSYFTSSVVGQESSDWVHFNHPTVAFEPLYSNKRASIQGCSSCIVVKWQNNPVTGLVSMSNVEKVLSVCNLPNGYGRGLYVGTSTAAANACVVVTLQLALTP